LVKFSYSGLLQLKLPQKTALASKEVKRDSKIIMQWLGHEQYCFEPQKVHHTKTNWSNLMTRGQFHQYLRPAFVHFTSSFSAS